MKELNKFHVVDKNLHAIRNEILEDYDGEFEMVGFLVIGDQSRQTHIRFRNFTDYESYINAIDQDYESDDAIFNGYLYKINTPQFNSVNISQYGNGCDFKHEIIEYRGDNCFIPTKGYCFIEGINYLTGEDYKRQYLDFLRNEKRRSKIMTKARIQLFRRAREPFFSNVILEYFYGTRIFPRSVRDRNNALSLYNNHFCL